MIVGLAGYAGSGKDTAAQCLIQRGWRQDSFASPLKEMALDMDPVLLVPICARCGANLDYSTHKMSCYSDSYDSLRSLSYLVEDLGWDEAKSFPEVRRYLQSLGTLCRNHLGEDVWVTAVKERWASTLYRSTVITDVRYPNEARSLLNWGIQSTWGTFVSSGRMPRKTSTVLIWISRPGVGPVNDHPSDQGLARSLCTHEIVNDGSVEELWAKVLEVVR